MVDEHLFVIVLAVIGRVASSASGAVSSGTSGAISASPSPVSSSASSSSASSPASSPLALGPVISKELDIVFRAAAGFGFLLGDQGGAVASRDLVIVGMDFGEGQEALAVAAIFDKGGLQRRLNARHLRKIDVALERPLGRGLEIEFLDLVTVENDDPGFFRVAGVDKHALGHGNLRCARGCGRPALRRAARGGANVLVEKRRANPSVETAMSFKEKGAGTASEGSANLTVMVTSRPPGAR